MSTKDQNPLRTTKSYCRFCHAYCAMEIDSRGDQIVAVRGDPSDPMYGGYTCEKGRELVDVHNHPDRIRASMKKNDRGEFETIDTQRALDEIASKLKKIIEEHGPQAVASYNGTHAFQNSAALMVSAAWHKSIGSPSYYTSVTIDQPAKFIAPSRVGGWEAGGHSFTDADVVMFIGNNTIVSHYAQFGGLPPFNASRRLRDAQKNGLKVICVDPRVTETARRADIHLQVRPGEDPTLLAGIVKVILDEKLHDAEFCERWVEGVEQLHEAVGDFTPEYVAQRADVPAELMVEAARLFARGPRGVATAGTGHNMSMRPNLAEHLNIALNVLCGRFYREGEKIPNVGILSPLPHRRAQAQAPAPAWGKGPQLRTRGLGQVFDEMPCAALPDEMLTPGEGQVKALLCIGGNPVVAWPDQLKTIRALESLDLFVTIDRKMSASAKRADYILAPKLSLEREDTVVLADSWYEEPYGHYTRAVVEPDLDLIEEWEMYWEISRRMGIPIELARGPLPLDKKPSKLEVLETMLETPRIPIAQLREQEGGRLYPELEMDVEPAEPGANERMHVAPAGIPEELREVRAETLPADAGYANDTSPFSHRLICRRLSHVYNSSGQEVPALGKKGTTNLAYCNPADLEAIGARSGDLLELDSGAGRILGVAEATDEVKSGVISMAHAFGGGPEVDDAVREVGSSTNRLIDSEHNYDPISGMARQSGIPINIRLASA